MAQLMFYERPIALNRERHKDLRLKVVENHYAFARNTNALPITSTEFAEASRDYPIVFVGGADGSFNVAALVGLRDNENLLVDENGHWESGTYIPAFARRYPFVLATTDHDEQLTVCVDEVYPGLSHEEGQALFDEHGAESDYLKQLLQFLQLFHAEAQRTSVFANRLKELGLLEPKVIHVERNGKKQTIQGLWTVDAQRLRGIDDARVTELFRSGYLSWIEAHLISLGSLPRLVARLDEHTQVSDEAGPVAPPEAPVVTH
ncbi:SapC family protein [Methylococcus sp. EFPC2]|uniref:SapC family protein n=1 Tax=Methylococcus sp. EFPC2 TaxID=2812648 RepID=UPI0019686BAB|nr:SapC family protein [Methylococcus sp. EFPC2]QSA95792.1 SapC family protein [Methylococcus sp. EFPC2]